MKYSLYKPNSKNTGSLFSFEIGTLKDGKIGLFVSIVQQSSWNDETKTGSFSKNAKDPSKSTTIKLSMNEAGEILSSIKTRTPYVAFHKNGSDTTIIRANPWDKDRKIKEQDGEKTYKTRAFAFSVSKNSTQNYKIALEAGETEVLSLLLIDFVNQSLFAEKEAFRKEYKDSNQKEEPKKAEDSSKDEDEDEDEDIPF